MVVGFHMGLGIEPRVSRTASALNHQRVSSASANLIYNRGNGNMYLPGSSCQDGTDQAVGAWPLLYLNYLNDLQVLTQCKRLADRPYMYCLGDDKNKVCTYLLRDCFFPKYFSVCGQSNLQTPNL